MTDYKAVGKQLECPPEMRGIPIDVWTVKQPLYSHGAVAKYLKDRGTEAAKPKTKSSRQ